MAGLGGLSGGTEDKNNVQLPEMPSLPKKIKEIDPSLAKWEDEMREFLKRFARALKRGS